MNTGALLKRIAAIESLRHKSTIRPMGKYRWVVVSLLFFATPINYLDRQVIGLLKDNLAKTSAVKDCNRIVMAFFHGVYHCIDIIRSPIDKIGTVWVYISIIIWSVAAMFHAMATSTQLVFASRSRSW
jgi:ACS family hexuronate transporter-like MFS transporter